MSNEIEELKQKLAILEAEVKKTGVKKVIDAPKSYCTREQTLGKCNFDKCNCIHKKDVVCKFEKVGTCTNEKCEFRHNKKQTPLACKFGDFCKREGCTFSHSKEVSVPKTGVCKFGPKCTRQGCTFEHNASFDASLASFMADLTKFHLTDPNLVAIKDSIVLMISHYKIK